MIYCQQKTDSEFVLKHKQEESIKIHNFAPNQSEQNMKIIVVSVLVVAVAVVLLGVRLLLLRNGSFVNTHIEGNKALSNKGIHCANQMLREEEQRLTLRDLMKENKI